MAKRKNKKRSSFNNMVLRLIKNKGHHIHILGSTVLTSPYSVGWDTLIKGTTHIQADAIMSSAAKCLECIRLNWTGIAFVFLKDGTFNYTDFIMLNAKSDDVNEKATKIVDDMWFEANASERLSTAWVMVPSDMFDVDANLLSFVDTFKNMGVWDKDKVKRAVSERSKGSVPVHVEVDDLACQWVIHGNHLKKHTIEDLHDKILNALSYKFEQGIAATIKIGSFSKISAVPCLEDYVQTIGDAVASRDFTCATSLDNSIMINVLILSGEHDDVIDVT